MDMAVAGYMEVEQTADKEQAYDELLRIILDTKSAFFHLDDIIEEIDKKHTRYMKNAVILAKFLLSTGNNMEGKLLRILGILVQELNEEENASVYENAADEVLCLFSLYPQRFLDMESLKTIPVSKKQGIVNEILISKEDLEELSMPAEPKKKTQILQTLSSKKEEFIKRGISSKVYVVCELLEIIDEEWKNAIEGYFNTQKFNLIVEPEYYNIALEVYQKNKEKIHTAGIVNTKKIEKQLSVDTQSIAYLVYSENRYAKAYADYILGRVIRCRKVEELERHKIAITADCMLYQGYVVRSLDIETYKNPFIGQNAYRVQIINTKQELQEFSVHRKRLRDEKQELSEVLSLERNVKLELTATYISAPFYLEQYELQKKEAEKDYKEAKKDQTLIELEIKMSKMQDLLDHLRLEKEDLNKENIGLLNKKEAAQKELEEKKVSYEIEKREYEEKSDANSTCKLEAEEKYLLNRKSKTPKTIYYNFSPQRTSFERQMNELLNESGGLKELQNNYNYKCEQDFLRGTEGIRDYIDEKAKLESVEMIRFEEQMKKAKEDCEEVFKSDFLAKMRNNIENARSEFKNLNKALKDIYYGEDSYHFLITFDKRKDSLYKMITSENNVEGMNLWTQAFEAEYKEEMEELFEKLVTKDDKGEKIIEEYTDYRSYLDYDIEIHKRNGTVQKFSDIYGEKS